MTKEDLAPYADKMEEYVSYFLTPLSFDKGGDCGVLCGTGTFFEKEDKVYLITCAHIISELKKKEIDEQRDIPLQCLFMEKEEYVPIPLGLFKKNDDLDVAVADITDIWCRQEKNDRKTFQFEKFKSTPRVDGEYFYTVGYPSFGSCMQSDTLVSKPQKYVTIECTLPELSDKSLTTYGNFALEYIPEKCNYTRTEMHLASDPRGISGSLIWNTHLTDELIFNKADWEPDSMTVAGVEFCWDEEKCVVCTKSCAIDFQNLI